MFRIPIGMFVLLAPTFLAPQVRAQDAKITGNWKVSAIIGDDRPTSIFILRITEDEKKLSGTLSPMKGLPPGFVEDIKVKDGLVHIKLRLQNRVQLVFEGKLPAEKAASQTINGSLEQSGGIFPAILEPTKAKNAFELDRELVEKSPNDPRVGTVVLDLLEKASAEKVAVGDVKDWVELALRSSETHGPRWHEEMKIRLLESLAENDYADLALTVGKKMEADFNPKAPFDVRIRFLEALQSTFTKARKADEAAKIQGKIDVLENEKYEEHAKSSKDVPAMKFAGRKADSTRAVLVELFTGAQCPPCVAADLAFDALAKTYKPSEVVLLEYHLHIPAPDVLTNPDSEDRQGYYKDAVEGTPTTLFNGKVEAPRGGSREDAAAKFNEYRGVVDQALETKTAVKISAAAVRKGNRIDINASVKNMGTPGDKIRLRLVLVEDWVRYKGSNGILYHHRVVRAMPGGAAGTPLPKMFGEMKTTVDLDDLRRDTFAYLNEFAKNERFPTAERPLRLRQLHLVAFVQDDATKEVLQALDLPVKSE